MLAQLFYKPTGELLHLCERYKTIHMMRSARLMSVWDVVTVGGKKRFVPTGMTLVTMKRVVCKGGDPVRLD